LKWITKINGVISLMPIRFALETRHLDEGPIVS